MDWLTTRQWRLLLLAAFSLLLLTGWRFVSGAMPAPVAGSGPVVVETPCDPGVMPPSAGGDGPADGDRPPADPRGASPDRETGVARPTLAAPEDDDRVDINRANAAELQRLPGIGPALAARIIDYREKWGPFTRPEDLLEVSGIGARTLERIRDRVRVGDP